MANAEIEPKDAPKDDTTEDDDEDIDLDLEDDDEDDDDGEKDKGKKDDEPKKETLEQRKARLQRQLARVDKKLGVDKGEKTEARSKKGSDDLDYGQKAFLVASGIKGKEETGLVRQVMAATGKSLEDVLESKYFQAELKEIREAKQSKEAVPSGSKRSGATGKDSVDYWIAKGEMPPAELGPELRRKYVNAKMKGQSSGSPFTSVPVVR